MQRVIMTSIVTVCLPLARKAESDSDVENVRVEVLQSRPNLVNELFSHMRSPALSAFEGQRQLFVMFTGNPGMVNFYTDFTKFLIQHAAAEGIPRGQTDNAPDRGGEENMIEPHTMLPTARRGVDLDVLVIGYAGHSQEEINNGKIFSLKDQEAMALSAMEKIMRYCTVPAVEVETVKEGEISYSEESIDENTTLPATLRGSQQRPRYTKIYLGGHSIGAYIATIACDAHRSNPLLSRVFLLAPTLCRMRESPEGLSKASLMNSKFKTEAAIFLSNSLRMVCPRSYLAWFVEKGEPKCTKDSTSASAVVDVMRGNVLRNVLTMAKSELDEVYDLDVERLHRIRDKVVAWFPKDDHWSPLPFYREIASALGVTSFTDKEIFDGSSKRMCFIGEDVNDNAVEIGYKEEATVKRKSPVCAVDSSDDFVHAWCLAYNEDLVMRAIIPYLEVESG